MALRSWRREGLVFQENDEKEKGLTITEDGLVSRTNYKLAVGARYIW